MSTQNVVPKTALSIHVPRQEWLGRIAEEKGLEISRRCEEKLTGAYHTRKEVNAAVRAVEAELAIDQCK